MLGVPAVLIGARDRPRGDPIVHPGCNAPAQQPASHAGIQRASTNRFRGQFDASVPATRGRYWDTAMGCWQPDSSPDRFRRRRRSPGTRRVRPRPRCYSTSAASYQTARPTSAVLLQADRMAIGSLSGDIAKRGLSIPADVYQSSDSTIASPIPASLFPPLTTVALPHYENGGASRHRAHGDIRAALTCGCFQGTPLLPLLSDLCTATPLVLPPRQTLTMPEQIEYCDAAVI